MVMSDNDLGGMLAFALQCYHRKLAHYLISTHGFLISSIFRNKSDMSNNMLYLVSRTGKHHSKVNEKAVQYRQQVFASNLRFFFYDLTFGIFSRSQSPSIKASRDRGMYQQ